ncbi:MAG: hypothetical protein CVU72_05070 [Deltaproteobacteria bacterium HGW-Deltaproteobacteria-7]|jgi:hypothetical protein|nr:MAG: hypothetical protein CVU72_05070 [Deltaproteobacteria bacterium HGW-Deltaproteobacteria-7]
MPLDIIFENEIDNKNAHYMKAVVYDCESKFITVSQTSPALTTHFLKRRVLTTFLAHSKNRLLRFGFSGLLYDLLANYTISSGQTAEALVIKKLNDLEPVDFRMYFRVTPPSQTDLRLYLKEEKVNLLDVSIGGAKFIYSKNYLFRPNDPVKFKLLIGNSVFDIDALVRSVRPPDIHTGNKNIQYVSVEFRIDDQKMEVSLGQAILNIERSLLSKGAI